MKNILYMTLLAACIAGLSSCESDIDNFMVDDTVGFLNPGLVDTKVYIGADDPTKVYAIKAGKGFQSAQASIKVDESVLVEYNGLTSTVVELSMLPADCYSIAVSSIELSNDDYRMPFEIMWNRDKLAAALAENPNQAIPLSMDVKTTGNIAKDRLTCIIKPTMNTPELTLSSSGLTTGLMPTRRSATEEVIYMNVNSNFIAQKDIDFSFEIDPSLITQYNEDHGTNYKLLPENAFEIALDGWCIKKYMNTARFNFKFIRTALIPECGPTQYGEYVLPIRMISEYETEPSSDKNYILYTISIIPSKIEKSTWSITECNSDINDDPDATEAEKANNGPDALIDGTTSKWWRSIYRYEQPMPYYAIIDLGRKTSIAKVDFEIPSGVNKLYANSKSGHVEFSLDGNTWMNSTEWSSSSAAKASIEFEVPIVIARYMKFVIDTPFKKASGSGIKNPNATAIGEISLWGEIVTWEDEE